MRQLIYNALRTPDGTILESRDRHDYRTHDDVNGKRYMIDGGTAYVRSSANGDEDYLTLYTDDNHSEIRQVFTWGTYGKSGDEPLRLVKLKDMTDNHIQAILDTQTHIPDYMRTLFENEQEYRTNGEITTGGI